ncbi:MAG: polysaccharide biosynthesis C-terminal domain-containing protein [Proteobacteria bacterium]|nr:polysaccharide biosynthesis C-terminal domain-containing protein [Pseudomonadota bacterium]
MVLTGLLLSQASEFGKDIFMGWKYGASMLSDGFFSAFSPIFLIYTTLLLSSSIVLIPAFVDHIENDDNQSSNLFYESTAFLIVLLGILSLVLFYFSDSIIAFLAPGLSEQSKLIAVNFFKRFIWVLMPTGCIAISASFLRSNNMLFIPSTLKFVGNVFFILILFYFSSSFEALSYAAISMFLMQFIFLVVFLFKTNLAFPTHFIPSKKTLNILLLFIIPILSIFMSQTVVLSERYYSSMLQEGSVSIIAYIGRIYSGFVNLIGGTVMGTALPALSGYISKGNFVNARDTITWNIKIVITVCLPASILLMIMAEPIISTIFSGSALTQVQMEMSYRVLSCYSIGIVFGAIMPLYTAVFSAYRSYSLILMGSTFFLVTNWLINALLINHVNILSLPIARTLSNIAVSIPMFLVMQKKVGKIFNIELLIFFIKVLAASLFMGLIVYYFQTILTDHCIIDSMMKKSGTILLSFLIAGIVFFVSCLILKMDNCLQIYFLITKKLRIS